MFVIFWVDKVWLGLSCFVGVFVGVFLDVIVGGVDVNDLVFV